MKRARAFPGVYIIATGSSLERFDDSIGEQPPDNIYPLEIKTLGSFGAAVREKKQGRNSRHVSLPTAKSRERYLSNLDLGLDRVPGTLYDYL